MTQKRPDAPAPAQPSLQAAAAAAMAGTVWNAQSIPVPPQFDPDDLVLNSHDREIVKGNQTRSHVSLYSPAMLQLLSLAYQRLLKVGEMRGMKTDLLLKVRAALRKSTRQVYIWPVDEDDPEGIPINNYDKGSAVWINLISLIGDTKLQVPTGYRDRYQATIARKDESPVGPALMFSLSRRISRTLKPGKPDETTAAAKTSKSSTRKQNANTTSTDQKKAEPTQPTSPETTDKPTAG
jgi:hypothetical protein